MTKLINGLYMSYHITLFINWIEFEFVNFDKIIIWVVSESCIDKTRV